MQIKKRYLLMVAVCLICVVIVVMLRSEEAPTDLYGEKAGQPLPGLSPRQLEVFEDGLSAFQHEFTPRQGLGPRFNGRSCFQCHGKPDAAGLEGRDVTKTGVTRIGAILPGSPLAKDMEKARQLIDDSAASSLVGLGGPVLQRRSTTDEFPDDYPPGCKVPVAQVPRQAQFVSLRHAGPLLGAGLIDAIDEREITANLLGQAKEAPDLVGRTNPLTDPLTLTTKCGRFGWKDEYPNLIEMTAAEMGTTMGITSFVHDVVRSSQNPAQLPHCLRGYLPAEPNDSGRTLVVLTAFQSLLAPPSRAALDPEGKRGKQIFMRLRCAVCHTPGLDTSPAVAIPDPDSPFPKLEYIRVKALENQPVNLYSDLLLHDMGPNLADGIVSGTARGGEWRTTPLWGIRFKRRFLHDGRADTIAEAILEHGGQCESVKRQYEKLPEAERKALLRFVGSL